MIINMPWGPFSTIGVQEESLYLLITLEANLQHALFIVKYPETCEPGYYDESDDRYSDMLETSGYNTF